MCIYIYLLYRVMLIVTMTCIDIPRGGEVDTVMNRRFMVPVCFYYSYCKDEVFHNVCIHRVVYVHLTVYVHSTMRRPTSSHIPLHISNPRRRWWWWASSCSSSRTHFIFQQGKSLRTTTSFLLDSLPRKRTKLPLVNCQLGLTFIGFFIHVSSLRRPTACKKP